MNQVHINGVALLPGVDYTASNSTLVLSVPPKLGDQILFTEVLDLNTGATHVTRFTGDGRKYLFKFDGEFNTRLKMQSITDDLYVYRNVPAVAEAIEKLQVILELTKQNATLHQR